MTDSPAEPITVHGGGLIVYVVLNHVRMTVHGVTSDHNLAKTWATAIHDEWGIGSTSITKADIYN